MKSKAPLTLMELLVMILVFSLAVGLCVRIFVTADLMSRDAEQKDRAVFLVQNAAEMVKHCRGDLNMVEEMLAGESDGAALKLYYDEEGNRVVETDSVYEVMIKQRKPQQDLFGAADVIAVIDGEEVFGLTVAFQEVNGHE